MPSSQQQSSYPVQSCDSKRIEQVQVYGPKWSTSTSSSSTNQSRLRVRWYHAIFGILYVYQLGWVVSTCGQPYRQFLEKADREGFAGKIIILLRTRVECRKAAIWEMFSICSFSLWSCILHCISFHFLFLFSRCIMLEIIHSQHCSHF